MTVSEVKSGLSDLTTMALHLASACRLVALECLP